MKIIKIEGSILVTETGFRMDLWALNLVLERAEELARNCVGLSSYDIGEKAEEFLELIE